MMEKEFEAKVMNIAIKLVVVGALLVWTYYIIRPFLMPVIWGIILAVAVEPFVDWCTGIAKGRRRLVLFLLLLFVIVALVIPIIKISASSYGPIHSTIKNMDKLTLSVPPPSESVKSWPIVGGYLYGLWERASSDLGMVLRQFAPQIKSMLMGFLHLIGGGLKAVLLFVISIFISFALLLRPDAATSVSNKVLLRLSGDKAQEISDLAVSTIRAVMMGVVGVAVIQSILSAIGLYIADVPFPGLWAILVLVCAVMQLSPILILGPISVWAFMTMNTFPAVIFLIWNILVAASDNVLKPLLLGRGVKIPTLVILLGAFGGMLLSGILGLFLGAVIIAITYNLFMAWVEG